MNKMVYLNAEELAYVNAKGKGYLRRLVQADMGVVSVPDRIPARPTCKQCGGMVMAGKCLVCKTKQ